MAREKTPAEELETHITRSDSALGKGKWSFQLTCKTCQDVANIPARMQVVRHPRFIRKAAMDFAAQGWRLDELPLCPKCSGVQG